MNWFKVTLPVADVASGRNWQFEEAFDKLFIAAGGPKDAGMFGSMDLTHNDFFFSPGAVRIAKSLILAYGGTQCLAPTRSDVALLVTNFGAEDIPFAREN